MKKIWLFIAAMTVWNCYAQNVGIGTKSPQNKLHVAGGLRIDSLSKRDSGIILHNNSGDVYSVKLTGRKTDVLTGAGTFVSAAVVGAAVATPSAWLLKGNAGTGAADFLGTTDAVPLRFRVNNRPYGILGANVAFGVGAISLPEEETGDGNVAIGGAVMTIMKNGYYNTGVGSGALQSYIGPPSLDQGDIGQHVALGAYALRSNIQGDNHTAIGYEALGNEKYGKNLTAVGYQALANNDGGIMNTAVGFQAMARNATGGQNTALGYTALYNNASGNQNTAMGLESLYWNTTGSGNTAFGFRSLAKNTGSNNTGTGSDAMLANTSGINNSATGYRSLYSNTTGSFNQAFGYKALYSSTTAINNTSVGYRSAYFTTTGSHNTALGYIALNTNTTGNNNTAVGEGADVTSGALSNATAIGYNAKVNASNKVRIGNASVTKIEGQVPFSTPSDGRYKFNVKEDVKGLEFILQLRPVTYQFDVNKFDRTSSNRENDYATQVSYARATQVRRTGFIAQEVKQAAAASTYNFSGISEPETAQDHFSLSYETFVVPLVKAVQEQQYLINRLQKKIEIAEKIAGAQEIKMNKFECDNRVMKQQLADFAERMTRLESK